jgi:hypothetical protein
VAQGRVEKRKRRAGREQGVPCPPARPRPVSVGI